MAGSDAALAGLLRRAESPRACLPFRRHGGARLAARAFRRTRGRARRLARRQRAPQVAGRARIVGRGQGAPRRRGFRSARSRGRGTHARPRLEPPAIYADVPRYAETQVAREARALPRPLRRGASAPREDLSRIRRPRHGAAARLSRRRALLGSLVERRLPPARARADAGRQRPQRPVSPRARAARRRGEGRALRAARVPAHRRPCRVPPALARSPADGLLPPMKLPAEIFRTYDIRGVVARSLTPDIVHAIGRALG